MGRKNFGKFAPPKSSTPLARTRRQRYSVAVTSLRRSVRIQNYQSIVELKQAQTSNNDTGFVDAFQSQVSANNILVVDDSGIQNRTYAFSEVSSNDSSSLDFLGLPTTPPHDESSTSNGDGDSIEQFGTSSEPNPVTEGVGMAESAGSFDTEDKHHRERIDNRRKQSRPRKYDKTTKEMIKLQRTTDSLIPKIVFQRLVREVLQGINPEFRVQLETLQCLQEASEAYITSLFEDSYLCTLHRSRVTLTRKDFRLVRILRGPVDPGRK